MKTDITYDLKSFDAPQGNYQLVDAITGKELISINGSKTSTILSYEFTK